MGFYSDDVERWESLERLKRSFRGKGRDIMGKKKDRDRSNEDGQYVSDEFADKNPLETTSEEVKADPLKKWFKLLKKEGVISYLPTADSEAFEAYGETFYYISSINVQHEDRMSRDEIEKVFGEDLKG